MELTKTGKVSCRNSRKNQIEKYDSQIEMVIEKYHEVKQKENYAEEEAVLSQMKTVNMPYSMLIELKPLNILCYLNYNGKLLERKNLINGDLLIEKLMQLDYSSSFAREQAATFVSWASGFNYSDEEIYCIVRKICKASGFSDTNLLLSLQSSLEAALCFKSAKYVNKTRLKIRQNYKESKLELTQ